MALVQMAVAKNVIKTPWRDVIVQNDRTVYFELAFIMTASRPSDLNGAEMIIVELSALRKLITVLEQER